MADTRLTPNAVVDCAFEDTPPTADEWRRMAIGMATHVGHLLPSDADAGTATIAALRAALKIVRSGALQPMPHFDA